MKNNFKLNTILVGDILEKLAQFPDDFVDIVITSPPYNKKSNSHGWLVKNGGYNGFEDCMPEDEYQDWQISVLQELLRITKPGGSVFYNHKIRWKNGQLFHPLTWISCSDWHIRQEIIWDRSLAANMRGWRFWQVDERIYWLYKPIENHLVGKEIASKHAKLSSIWRIKPASRSDLHPAPFPIEIPTRIIYSIANDESKIVLDPFCGIGTTLVAAKLLGHSYIGIDTSHEYVQCAKDRLKNAENERNIVDDEKRKHVVDDPFIERKKRGTVNWPYGPKNGNETKPEMNIQECEEKP